MRQRDSKPPIRILILGAPGVGKNCLESRFTTSTYPPPYNPALTLSSRRYLTLSPRPISPPEPSTRPLDTSYGLPSLQQTSFARDILTAEENPANEGSRPHTASSTFSNPASAPITEETAVLRTDRTPARVTRPFTNQPCPTCQTEAHTYLIELTNNPSLQHPASRAAVLAKGDYDAVLLVYDVASRLSFDAVPALAGEIPLYHTSRLLHRKGMRMKRVSVVEGLNRLTSGEERGGQQGRRTTRLRRRRSAAVVVGDFEGGQGGRVGSAMSFRRSNGTAHGTGPVVALVGNKADVDNEVASIDFGGIEAKQAALEEVDVEERGLVHPLYRESQLVRESQLYRESRLYQHDMEGGKEIGVAVGIPEARDIIATRPRTVVRRSTSNTSNRPLLSPYSGRSFAWEGQVREESVPGRVDDECPLTRNTLGDVQVITPSKQSVEVVAVTSKPNPTAAIAMREHAFNSTSLDSIVRRSALSADYHLLSTNRTSILSKRSVRTMQEGSKPLVLTKLPKSEAVENWIRTGSPTTSAYPDEEEYYREDEIGTGGSRDGEDGLVEGRNGHGEREEKGNGEDVEGQVEGRGRSYSTTTTAACRRQVSRMEAEILARTLMLDVPFYETSAKTGDNVEEMFEAVVREVLRERGEVINAEAVVAECKRKHGYTNDRTTDEGRARMAREVAVESTGDGNEMLTGAVLDETAVDEAADGPDPPPTMHRRRRTSMLDRFRKVFTRKSVLMVDDVSS